MKNIAILFFFLVIVFSCAKKGDKKEQPQVLEPILKDSIEQIDEIKENISKLFFTVQIAALRKNNSKFENLENVTIYQENSLIKYRLGSFETYKEAREFRLKARKKYKGAFVQAIKNKEPIAITDALQ